MRVVTKIPRRSLAQRFEKQHQGNPESLNLQLILMCLERYREQNVSAGARLRNYVDIAVYGQRSFLHTSQAKRGGCRLTIENRIGIKTNSIVKDFQMQLAVVL